MDRLGDMRYAVRMAIIYTNIYIFKDSMKIEIHKTAVDMKIERQYTYKIYIYVYLDHNQLLHKKQCI